MVNQQYLKMTERQGNTAKQYQPKLTYSQLQSIFKTSEKCQLQHFIQYCYYVVKELEQNKYQKIDKEKFQQIVNKKVTPTYMPCLIYEHLLQTFASIFQAFEGKDKELIDYQVKEVKQSVVSYMSRPSLKPEREYQSYYSLQITDNTFDLNLKANLYNETLKLFNDMDLLFKQTKGNKNQKKNSKKQNNNEQKIKQKKEMLKERSKKVQNTLEKVANKKNRTEPTTEENQQKYFVLWKAIQMNWASEEKNL